MFFMAAAAAIQGIGTLAKEWAVSMSGEQVEAIAGYFELLLQWNARVNLTGADGLEALLAEHLPDSFALARLAPASASVVDVGAGGGLPGVPFAVLRPDCQTTLLEPRAKRTAFLAAAKRQIGRTATFEVVRGRDEDLASGGYDMAASRATFQVEEWLRVAARLIRPGGRVIVFATGPVAATSSGFELLEGVPYRTGWKAPRWVGSYVRVPAGSGC